VDDELSYSARLVLPFLRVLRASGKIPSDRLAQLDALDPDRRLPLETVHRMLETAVSMSGDPDIGLKAARECTPGDGGVLDYAISSASTVRDAIDAAVRYVRLVNDALELRFETIGAEAVVRVENRIAMPRAAMDYQMGAIHSGFSHIWASGAAATARVLLSYAAPADTSEYAPTFGNLPIEFGAPFSGFVFDAACLGGRLASADSRLHDVIVRQAEQMLEELPRARPLTERVRSALLIELAGGNPSVTQVAPRLHMSPRTLERRLEREGTTFSNVLDDLRKRLALRYVASKELELAEIAFLLGFSQTTAFHRAFKRWTGETPLNYRCAQQAAQRVP
jgi:AraC-like DNA-binding protein